VPGDWFNPELGAEFDDASRAHVRSIRQNVNKELRFKLVRSKDVQLSTTPAYLVQDLVPREGLVLVWGPPKCGKTFWVFDMMMHVALERCYRDRRVEAGTVVYIACEGERGLTARNAAFRQSKLSEDEDPPFYLLTTRLDLPGEVDKLMSDIAAQIPETPCAAIVLDTLNRSIRGSESSDEDMNGYIAAADALRERFKCTVIIIHHCGLVKDRPRGHTSLTGAVDAQIAVKRNGTDEIVAMPEWMKDGPEGGELVSRLEPVTVGVDDNGTPITSCVIASCSDRAAKNKLVPKLKLPAAAQTALNQLKNALATTGAVAPACDHIPSNVLTVDYDLWRRYCYAGGISSTDSAEAKKKAFGRAADNLIANEFVKRWEQYVWLPPGQPGQGRDMSGQCPEPHNRDRQGHHP
jgi:hypothetical protein